LLLKKEKPKMGFLTKFFNLFNKVFDKSTSSYMKYVNVFTKRIFIGLIFIGILMVSTLVVSRFVPGGFIPEEDQGYLYINAQLPNAFSLQRTDAVTKEIEEVLNDFEDIEFATNLFISLKDWEDRKSTALEIAKQLNFKLRRIRGARIFAFGPPAIPGLGSGSGFTIMLQDKGGNTAEYLSKQTWNFIARANQRPEIGRIFTTYESNVPQRFMNISFDKALKYGVSLSDLYTTIGAYLGGAYVNDFNRFGRLYKAYIQAENKYRINKNQMRAFFVKNDEGKMVPLNSIIDVENIQGPEFINRFNLYRATEVSGTPAPGYSSDQALAALEEVAEEVLPPEMDFEWSNMSYQEKKAAGTGAIVFVFSLVFVFLILAGQYESWSLPLSILLGTPLAVFGATVFLFFARFVSKSYELNVFAQIALVMLIAMAAKNAILIVEFAKIKFESGMSLIDAAIEAARLRFRPILMTAFSFILGVFPLVVASGAGAEARKVMGMALMGGMLIATCLGVFIYPLLFALIGTLFEYEKKRPAAEKKQVNEK
jgi:HAE1 family hydrophobic/amphiphilic exporter-1